MSALPSASAPMGRHVGVTKAGSQLHPDDQKTYGKKNTLIGFMEMRTFVLLYHDGTGLQQKPHVVHEFGGVFYSAPNAVEWGQSLRPLEPWIQELAAKHLAKLASDGSAPADNVDIVPEVT